MGEGGFGACGGLVVFAMIGAGERDRAVRRIVMEVCGWEVKWRGRRSVGDGSLVGLVGRKRKDLMFYGRPFWNERTNRKAGIMVVCQRKILFFFRQFLI